MVLSRGCNLTHRNKRVNASQACKLILRDGITVERVDGVRNVEEEDFRVRAYRERVGLLWMPFDDLERVVGRRDNAEKELSPCRR